MTWESPNASDHLPKGVAPETIHLVHAPTGMGLVYRVVRRLMYG